MTVAELIALLKTLPKDKPVGFINRCADDGSNFVTIDCAEVSTPAHWTHNPGLPKTGAVVLS